MSTGGDVPDSTVNIPKHPSMDSLQELTKTSKQKVRSPAPSVSSHRSCASSVRLQQKLAAETAKKRLEFLEEESKLLEEKLEDFGVSVKVVEVNPGPVITRFEIQPAPGVKVSKISNYFDEIMCKI